MQIFSLSSEIEGLFKYFFNQLVIDYCLILVILVDDFH